LTIASCDSGLIQIGLVLAGLADDALAGGAIGLAGSALSAVTALPALSVTTLTDLPGDTGTRAGRTSEAASVSVGRLIVVAVFACVMGFVPVLKFFNDLGKLPTTLANHRAMAAIRLVLKNRCKRGR
jgi:hypothetical protein